MSDTGVTAVMPTSGEGIRRQLALVAVSCFQRQTYPEKTLLILNHGDALYPEGAPPNVLEQLVKRPPTLGELRNLAFEHIKTPYFISWDDDDWSHPTRIERQYTEARDRKKDACVLSSYLTLDFKTGQTFARAIRSKHGGGCLNTILAKITDIRYPAWHRHEDSVFGETYRERGQLCILSPQVPLYVRTCHGENTSGRGHIMSGAKFAAVRRLSTTAQAIRAAAASDFAKVGIVVPPPVGF